MVIIPAGGKETGARGKEVEAAIKNEIKHSGLRVIGPNCLGIVCGKATLNASFARRMPLKCKMAFISQSGAIYTSILDLSIKEQFGFSYFINLGSMLDVVILYIKMPGMDGIETLQEIKKRFPLVEVIMLTGHGSTETAVEGMKLGAFDYLLKPAYFNDLYQKLEAARKRKDEQEDRIRMAEAKSILRKTGGS